MSLRVLFFHPRRASVSSRLPHAGLAYLAGSLRRKGHDAKIVDYVATPDAPPPNKFLDSYKPDVVGISMYTACAGEGIRLIDVIHKINPNLPILIGGPHTVYYADELAQDPRVHAVVVGEADLTLPQLLENLPAYRGIVRCETPKDLDVLALPDPSAFWGCESFQQYSMLTSRGCPYSCSFCEVRNVASRKWRGRDIKLCIKEIRHAQKSLPMLTGIIISDDCPTLRMERFKEFLRSYIRERFPYTINIGTVRADLVDEEMVRLIRRAHSDTLLFGAEHGDPEVFALIHKGEKQEEIERASRWVKEAGLRLGLSFIVGLPGDDINKSMYSLRWAHSMNPDYIVWNMLLPLKGSPVFKWFEEHGKVYETKDRTLFIEGKALCDEPTTETTEFSRKDRVRALLRAVISTGQYKVSRGELAGLIKQSVDNNLAGALAASLARKTGDWLKAQMLRFSIAFTRRVQWWLVKEDRSPAISDKMRVEITSRRFRTAFRELLFQYPYSPETCLWRAKEITALEELKFDEPVLELGCGDGGMAFTLFAGEELHGIDSDEKLLMEAEKRGLYKKLSRTDYSQIPYPDGFFGSVLLNRGDEFAADPETLLKEAFRVTRSGGIIAMTALSQNYIKYNATRALFDRLKMPKTDERLIERHNRLKNHIKIENEDTWKKRFEGAGWGEFRARPVVEPETAVFCSALTLVPRSLLSWDKSGQQGGIGARIERHADGYTGGQSRITFWQKFIVPLVGYLPDPPPRGAGWLFSARKP